MLRKRKRKRKRNCFMLSISYRLQLVGAANPAEFANRALGRMSE